MDTLSRAREWRKMGVAVIPLRNGQKHPLRTWLEWQSQLPSEAQLRHWFFPGQVYNYGVVCGWQGLTVLDFDGLGLYLKWREWAEDANIAAQVVAAEGYQVTTGRGVHVYAWLEEPCQNAKLAAGDTSEHLDVKAAGGYVVGEGSIHPTGAIYQALTDNGVIFPVAHLEDLLPDWLRDAAPPLHTEQRIDRVASVAGLAGVVTVTNAVAQYKQGADDPWAIAENPPSALQSIKADCDWINSQLRAVDLLTTPLVYKGKHSHPMANCPLHDDKSPSLMVREKDGQVLCLAGCYTYQGEPAWMDAVILWQKMHNLKSVNEAVRELKHLL